LDIEIFLVVALERWVVRRFAQYSGGFPAPADRPRPGREQLKHEKV
jgi:hypothetical protein